jgi:ParB/RepB/Spo0J family partition protein
MDDQVRRVSLPDGEIVTVHDSPVPWWVHQDGTGYVHPKMCAPDPNQPRRHISQERLAELYESILSTGVREPITITPRHLAPWVEVTPEFEDAYFVIVSGHRRWGGASRANFSAMPVRIRIYASAATYYLDASLLNSNREDLSALEEAFETVSLRARGLSLEAIAKHFGKSVQSLYNRMHLTKLAPDIQDLLNPSIQERKRLAVTIATELGAIKVPAVEDLDAILEKLGPDAHPEDGFDILFEELDEDSRRFELQRMFLRVIEHGHMNAFRAINLIKAHTQDLVAHTAGEKKAQRFQPARRRKIVTRYLSEVTQSSLYDWRPADFHEAFDSATDEELDIVIASFTQAEENLAALRNRIERIKSSRVLNDAA